MANNEITGTADYFWLQEAVGRGGFGQVCKGRSWKTGEFVAVKLNSGPDTARAQRNEGELLSQLTSPYTVKHIATQEVNGSQGQIAIIMELADGSVRDELRKPENCFGLPYGILIRMICHLGRCLRYLSEKRVVHRDIKPHNILIFNSRSNPIFKLCDFGVSTVVEDSLRPLETVVGTRGYLNAKAVAKLAHLQRENYNKRECDLWSIGCTIFECATGHLPFIPARGFGDDIAMHNMLAKRPNEAICGEEIKEGDYKWETELQQNRCSYPRSLRRVLSQVLRHLFNKSPSKPLTTRMFTEMCEEISELRTFRLININKLSLEDYFDTSSSNFFEKKSFGTEILDELPPHDTACLLSMPSGTALYSISQLEESVFQEATDVVIMATQKRGEDYIVPVIEPIPATQREPRPEELEDERNLRKAMSKAFHLEKQTEALLTFVEGSLSFCSTFWEMLNETTDDLAAEVKALRQFGNAVSLQSTSMAVRRSGDESIAIERKAKNATAEVDKTEDTTEEIKRDLAELKKRIEQVKERKLFKRISIKESLSEIYERVTENKIDGNDSGAMNTIRLIYCKPVAGCVKRMIQVRKESLDAVCNIVSSSTGNSIEVLLRGFLEASEKIGVARQQLSNAMGLLAEAQQENLERNEKWKRNRVQNAEFAALLRRSVREAKEYRRQAEESLRRTTGWLWLKG